MIVHAVKEYSRIWDKDYWGIYRGGEKIGYGDTIEDALENAKASVRKIEMFEYEC